MRAPDVQRGLGVGLDLPWGGPTGFVRDASGDDRLSPRIATWLAREGAGFAHAFVSWQPNRRGTPRLEDYAPAWDALFAEHAWPAVRGLHHTALNTATTERIERGPLLAFTNALVDRYGLRWVNEDLGLWSLGGKPVPYPLAPLLTDAGLAACVRNVDEVQRGLVVPFVVEFPGFTDGIAIRVGRMDPYDFFRQVIADTDAPCCLDTGHLLGARWLLGFRGEDLLEGLETLPLAHCVEIHLSGCSVIGDRFVDGHHGVLLDLQLRLLERLLPICPNLRAITYEDPRFTADGRLIAPALAGVSELRRIVEAWA